ncbi:dephospho-CoA kinase [bacterium]|nr:dephospho-CoA kinase [bacterium]
MRRIAIVGNIASGKTEVEKILKKTGFMVLDTDKVGHDLLEYSDDVKVVFKDFDILEEGKISREKLGKIVFANEKLLEKLNSVLHPLIAQRILDFFEINKDQRVLFVAIPLLFEAGMEDLFDEIIFVYANDDIRLERLIRRNGYTREYALKRMNAQIPQQEKISKADFVINNEGTLADLEDQTMQLLTNHSF